MDIENICALIFGFFVAILLLDFNTLEKTVSKQKDNFNRDYDQLKNVEDFSTTNQKTYASDVATV